MNVVNVFVVSNLWMKKTLICAQKYIWHSNSVYVYFV